MSLNISGDTTVSTFGDKYGLFGWTSGSKSDLIYGNISVRIATTSEQKLGGLSLTAESNNAGSFTINGNLKVDILSGNFGLCSAKTTSIYSLTSGLKGAAINGDITFNLGSADTSGPSFEGYVVGGPVTIDGAKGSVNGDITLNINSGTYNGIAGNGHGSLTGNVIINLNGGTYNGDIYGSLAPENAHTGSYTVNYYGGSFGDTGCIRNTSGSWFSQGSNLNVYGSLRTTNAEIQYINNSTVKDGGTLTIDTTVDSYAKNLSVESGGGLSLATGGSLVVAENGSLIFAEGSTLTLGVGLRAQTLIGENLYNRSSLLEGRLLATFDVGDRLSSTAAGLALLPGSAGNIHSAELSVCGFEAGVGLSVPLGQSSGTLFIDGSFELRADYHNLNATVGWRINF